MTRTVVGVSETARVFFDNSQREDAKTMFTFEYFTGEIERLILETPSTLSEHANTVKQMRLHLETCQWFYENADLMGLDGGFYQLKLMHLHYMVNLYELSVGCMMITPPKMPKPPKPPVRSDPCVPGRRSLVNGIASTRMPKRGYLAACEGDIDDEDGSSVRKRTRVKHELLF